MGGAARKNMKIFPERSPLKRLLANGLQRRKLNLRKCHRNQSSSRRQQPLMQLSLWRRCQLWSPRHPWHQLSQRQMRVSVAGLLKCQMRQEWCHQLTRMQLSWQTLLPLQPGSKFGQFGRKTADSCCGHGMPSLPCKLRLLLCSCCLASAAAILVLVGRGPPYSSCPCVDNIGEGVGQHICQGFSA